jgi:thioesterase domain-containing protein
MFRPLGEAFGESNLAYGINMRGSETWENPLESIEAIATKYIEWAKSVQHEGNYKLIGHCFGGNIVYEMAKQLIQEGKQVDFIAIIEGTPGRPINNASADTHVGYFLKLLSEYFERLEIATQPYPHWISELRAGLMEIPLKNMAHYASDFIKEKYKRKKRLIEFTCQLINVRLSNAHIHYQPCEEIDTKLIVLKGERTGWWKEIPDETLGWGKFARESSAKIVRGGDYNMIDTTNHHIDKISASEIVKILNNTHYLSS